VDVLAAQRHASPAQVWQWIQHGATLQPGDQKLTAERFRRVMDEELATLQRQVGCPYRRFSYWPSVWLGIRV
jgi:malate synthase